MKFVCNWPGAAPGHWDSWPLSHFWSYLQPLFTSITLPQQHSPPCPLNRSSTLLTQAIAPPFSLQYGSASAFLFLQLGTLIPSGCPIPTLAASLWSISRYFLLPNSGWPVNARGRACHSPACSCYPLLRVPGLRKPPRALANVKGILTWLGKRAAKPSPAAPVSIWVAPPRPTSPL